MKQLLVDMENQLLQVKTQVAIAMADGHLLERKRAEHEAAAESWKARAALAVGKGHDDLAREALGRSLGEARMAAGFAEQVEDQRAEGEMLRTTFRKLEMKLGETRQRAEMLGAERRRVQAVSRAHAAMAERSGSAAGESRLRARLEEERGTMEAQRLLSGESGNGGRAWGGLGGGSLEERFVLLEREGQIEALLAELKGERLLAADGE